MLRPPLLASHGWRRGGGDGGRRDRGGCDQSPGSCTYEAVARRRDRRSRRALPSLSGTVGPFLSPVFPPFLSLGMLPCSLHQRFHQRAESERARERKEERKDRQTDRQRRLRPAADACVLNLTSAEVHLSSVLGKAIRRHAAALHVSLWSVRVFVLWFCVLYLH